MFCLVGITGECHIFAVEVLYSRIGINFTPAILTCKRKWEGSQPRLRCGGGRWLFQRENGRVFLSTCICVPHIFLVIFVLQTEAKGIKRINSFVWKGSTQKKVVLNKGRAELPQNKGGLAIPNLNHFWDGLKLAWLSRLFQVHDDTTWKRLAMSKISLALKLPGLTLERLLLEGPESISRAFSSISNPFWQAILNFF